MTGALKKRQYIELKVISHIEIADFWRSASAVGPYPGQEMNEAIAEVATKYRFEQTFQSDNPVSSIKDVLSAIKVLQNVCENSWSDSDINEPLKTQNLSYRDPIFFELEDILFRLKPKIKIFDVRPFTWEVGGCMVFGFAAAVLKELGRTAGRSRESVAVRFTALVLNRMGYVSVNPPAIEALLKRSQKKAIR